MGDRLKAFQVLATDRNASIALKRMFCVQLLACTTMEDAMLHAQELVKTAEPCNEGVRLQTFPPSLASSFLGIDRVCFSRTQFTHILSVVLIQDEFYVGLSPRHMLYPDTVSSSDDSTTSISRAYYKLRELLTRSGWNKSVVAAPPCCAMDVG